LRVSASIWASSTKPVAAHKFAPKKQVRGCIQIVGQGEILVDGLDLVVTRIARIVDRCLLAIDVDLAAVALQGARQHFHQNRFARAVVAEHTDHFARVEVDGDMVDGLDAAERFHHVTHFNKRCAHVLSPVRRR
jgi:hypothetical protein